MCVVLSEEELKMMVGRFVEVCNRRSLKVDADGRWGGGVRV